MRYLLFVGTLNQPTSYFESANGDGLSVYEFDEDTLTARRLANTPFIPNPTFLTPTADGSFLYANSEIEGWTEGLVTAFRFDAASGTLAYLNMQPSLGSITAHNTVSRDGRRLFVVNYAMGSGGPDQAVVAFDLRADGSLAAPAVSAAQSGSGPNPLRQERSHPHCVLEIRDGLLLVTDLGGDTLSLYRAGADRLEKVGETRTRPGQGPRHMVPDPSGRFVFVINELGSTVASYRFDEAALALEEIAVHSTLPEQGVTTNHSADIRISADGRFLYGTNRGHDSIVTFAVDPSTGGLTRLGFSPSGGRTPRNIALTPSGRFLLCANQDSDVVAIFTRDRDTGLLTDTGKTIAVGTPMCVRFATPPAQG